MPVQPMQQSSFRAPLLPRQLPSKLKPEDQSQFHRPPARQMVCLLPLILGEHPQLSPQEWVPMQFNAQLQTPMASKHPVVVHCLSSIQNLHE